VTSRQRSVLITHEVFPPDIRGGGEYVAMRVATGLRDRGIRTRVLTTGDPAVTSYEGVETERLPVGRYGFNLRVARIVAAARTFDLIQTFNYHACLPSLLAARYLGKPVVCEILGLFGPSWRDMRGPATGRLFEAWERFIVSRPYDSTLFLSESSRREGIALGAAPPRCSVNTPGIDFDQLECSEVRQPFVLFAGRFDVRKGIHELLTVAAALPHVSFQAVGWGAGAGSLREANLPNLAVHVEDAKTGGANRYRKLLRNALVLLFPSHAETFGLVMAEAMASGCAIVSTVDTMPFAGTPFAPGDTGAMIAAIRQMWSDPEGTRELGIRNRSIAGTFTWDAHIDRLLHIYDSHLDPGRPMNSANE
jgi:glycosyltransferase involved in cell wall biosynthesis